MNKVLLVALGIFLASFIFRGLEGLFIGFLVIVIGSILNFLMLKEERS